MDGNFYQRALAKLHGAAAAGAGGNPDSNPFFKNDGTYSNNQGVQSLIGGGYRAGAFDPTGGGAAYDALAKYYGARGDADVRQAQTGAELYAPNDPLTSGYARMNAEQHARDNTTMGLGAARAGFAKNNQDHLWALLQQYLQPTLERRPKGPGVGGYIAQLGGAALGAL